MALAYDHNRCHEFMVTPQEFHQIMEWSLLPEFDFVRRMLDRWPHLRDHLGEDIKVVVDSGRYAQAG